MPFVTSIDMSPRVGMTPNRAIFLYHLRVNPGKVSQVTGILKSSLGEMCAIGLACDAFKIPMTRWEKIEAGYDETFDPYSVLAAKVEVPRDAIVHLYYLNDSENLTFKQVARLAELYFNSNQAESVKTIWRKLKEKGEF